MPTTRRRVMRKPYTKAPLTLKELYDNSAIDSNGCRIWLRGSSRGGYGSVSRNKRRVTVTRLVLHFVRGFDLNSKDFVLHRCDNPKCINPKHLYVGNQKQNCADKVKRD